MTAIVRDNVDEKRRRLLLVATSGAVLTVLEGRLEFVVTGVLSTTAPGTVTGSLRYQRCIGGACLPPTTTAWSVSVPAPIAAVTWLRN